VAGGEEIAAGGDLAAQLPTDAQYQGEVERENQVIDGGKYQETASGDRVDYEDSTKRV
jgi:hypothetical protein